MRKATLTVTLSTNPATEHIGPFFADLRVNGRQMTRVGTALTLRSFINEAHEVCKANRVELIVKDDTYQKMFTGRGGLIGTAFSD